MEWQLIFLTVHVQVGVITPGQNKQLLLLLLQEFCICRLDGTEEVGQKIYCVSNFKSEMTTIFVLTQVSVFASQNTRTNNKVCRCDYNCFEKATQLLLFFINKSESVWKKLRPEKRSCFHCYCFGKVMYMRHRK